MDSSVEKGSGSLDPDERTASGEPKACTDCNATKTPLWRGGPCGPKSLCNACGIRYRKKRREALGLDGPKRREPAPAPASALVACTDDGAVGDEEDQQKEQQQLKTKKSRRVGGRDAVTVELCMVGFGKEVVLKQRRRMRRRRRLGEEEKAAILLMALSSGVIYAS